MVDVRLAPEHPHPAQLDDVETAYRWLLTQGCQPHHIGGAWLQDPAREFTGARVSLVHADLSGLPPTIVHYGEHEILDGDGDGAELGHRLTEFKVTSEVHPAARRTTLVHRERRSQHPGSRGSGPTMISAD